MLFFHEKVQLIKPPHNRTVPLLVIREGFSQPNERQAAFMLYFIAHGKAKLGTNKLPANPFLIQRSFPARAYGALRLTEPLWSLLNAILPHTRTACLG